MLLKLFLAFTLIPIMEIYLLIEAGQTIGSLSTVILVILSGITGAYLARIQGLNTMKKIQSSLSQGSIPGEELIDGAIILVAGIVLLTPGFITDIMGLLLLFPYTRFFFKRMLRHHFDENVRRKEIKINNI